MLGNNEAENEVVSETEDETQGPKLTMPKPRTSEELLEDIEGLVNGLKTSRAKDQQDCEKLQHILSRYKEACACDKKKVQAVGAQLRKAEESLDAARSIISTVADGLN